MKAEEIIGIVMGGFMIVMFLSGLTACFIQGLIVKVNKKYLLKNHPELFELMKKYKEKKFIYSEFYWTNVSKIKDEIDKKLKDQKYLTKKDIVESNKEIEKLREILKQNIEQSDKLYEESEKLYKQLINKIEELPKYKNFIHNYYEIKRTDDE